MATKVAEGDPVPDQSEFLANLDGLDDDWMAFLSRDSCDEELDAAFGDLESFFDDPAVTGSPESGLTHAGSPSKDEEGAGSGTEKSEEGGQKGSDGDSSSRATSKRLGKRKGGEHEESLDDGVVDEEEMKRRARLMRNRESAQLSRQRKKAYVDDLEDRVRTLNATVAELNNTVNLISAENVSLRNQLAYFYSSGAAPGTSAKPVPYAPPIGVPMYPYTAGGYVMRPGATAPPVPIPRLKTPATTVKSVKKARVSKDDGKTGAGKTKKLASLAAVGFLCFLALVFPLDLGIPRTSQVPWSSDSGVQTTLSSSNRIGGRVLMSWESNSSQLDWRPSDGGGTDIGYGDHENRAVIDGSTFPANVSYGGNVSHRFPASIWLPRENKVLKLDGDLIIQAVLAGNEAAVENKTEIAYPPALLNSGVFQDIAARALRTPQPQRALPSSATVSVNALPPADDAEDPQRKILGDLTGTVFSTGMCSEVFQFELSQAEAGTSAEAAAQTSTTLKRSGYHRRNLGTVPLSSGKVESLKRKKENVTNLVAEKQPSSMVVSIFNPAQAGASAKDLARIFVVVLIDSVKYVTYSCMLPQVVSG